MSEKIDPIRHKMTEAIPSPADEATHPKGKRPGESPDTPHKADQKQHNAEVQPGTKDHMVDIGRGEQIKGRG